MFVRWAPRGVKVVVLGHQGVYHWRPILFCQLKAWSTATVQPVETTTILKAKVVAQAVQAGELGQTDRQTDEQTDGRMDGRYKHIISPASWSIINQACRFGQNNMGSQCGWSCFLLGKSNDGLIDCHSLQAIRCKWAKQTGRKISHSCLVLHMENDQSSSLSPFVRQSINIYNLFQIFSWS